MAFLMCRCNQISNRYKATPPFSRFFGYLVVMVFVLSSCTTIIGIDAAAVETDSEQKVVKEAVKAVLPEEEKGDAGISAKFTDNLGFIHGFVGALTMIVVSELGDKTFFIAAIMAMRHARTTVFIGAIGALGLMTVLSAVLGYATTVIPRQVTLYISSALFAIFGIKMLKEGYYMSPDEAKEEYEEVQAELKKREDESMLMGEEATDEYEKQNVVTQDVETGIIRGGDKHRRIWGLVPRVFLQAFTLTFLAEWGDRSQIATIILGARENVTGVIIGGTIGHALCTGLAVMGGRFIAQRISIRTVTLAGGVVFLVFAASALLIDSYES